MKRHPLAVAGIAIAAALGTTAASAAYEVIRVDPVTGIERIEYVEPRPIVIYTDSVAPRERIVVESEPIYSYNYYSPDEILRRPGYPDLSGYPDRTAALNPQTGQLIDYGLFNRRGPNDFGR